MRKCLHCCASFFVDFDSYGNNRGLKCGLAGMKIGSQTEGLACFEEDTPEKIAEKEREYHAIFKRKV